MDHWLNKYRMTSQWDVVTISFSINLSPSASLRWNYNASKLKWYLITLSYFLYPHAQLQIIIRVCQLMEKMLVRQLRIETETDTSSKSLESGGQVCSAILKVSRGWKIKWNTSFHVNMLGSKEKGRGCGPLITKRKLYLSRYDQSQCWLELQKSSKLEMHLRCTWRFLTIHSRVAAVSFFVLFWTSTQRNSFERL